MKRTIEVVLVVIALVGSYPTHVSAQWRPMPRTATATTSLMAAYAMSNTMDASGNNRTAVFTDMSTVAGKYAEGQKFNGNTSRMTIPTFNVTSAFTIECWVYLNVNTRSVVGRTPRDPYGWQPIIYKNSDNFFIAEAGGFVTAGFSPTSGGVVQISSPSTITPLAFHHVAATYDGAGLTLYVDGAQAARVAATGSVAPSSEAIEVGGTVLGAFLSGTIDDVRIYSRALTAAEIVTDMATPVDTVREDVVSWDLDVFTKDAPSASGGSPVATANFLRSAALCGQAPATPPTATVQNPTTARVSDPAASGKECELMIENFILTLPAGVGYTSTARARGATTVADRSPASNPFDRVTCHCR